MEVTEMGKIVVVNNVSLDGVTQGLGRPDEDSAADSSTRWCSEAGRGCSQTPARGVC